jgi:DNA polymerase-3 subunit epsilon
MKSKKRIIVPNHTTKIEQVVEKLLKEPIRYEKFLTLLEDAKDTFFDNPELEFELLLSNGLPLDFKDDDVYLKTSKTKLEDQTFCIVDIETNGGHVKKGYQIIELGAVKYKNGQIIDKFESLVYAKEINEYIQEVTNITPSMLADAPTIEPVLKEFKLFLGDDIFVAHDIKFDYNFISDSFEKYDLGKLQNRKLCTIELAKRILKLEKYGLRSLKDIFQIDVDNHHRAYYDALATTHVLEKLLEKIDKEKVKTSEDLIYFSKMAKSLAIKKRKLFKKENDNV